MKRAHLSIFIPDLGCAGSAQPLDHALRRVTGVLDVYVNPITDTAYVTYDSDRCTQSQLEEAVRHAGFHLPSHL